MCKYEQYLRAKGNQIRVILNPTVVKHEYDLILCKCAVTFLDLFIILAAEEIRLCC